MPDLFGSSFSMCSLLLLLTPGRGGGREPFKLCSNCLVHTPGGGGLYTNEEAAVNAFVAHNLSNQGKDRSEWQPVKLQAAEGTQTCRVATPNLRGVGGGGVNWGPGQPRPAHPHQKLRFRAGRLTPILGGGGGGVFCRRRHVLRRSKCKPGPEGMQHLSRSCTRKPSWYYSRQRDDCRRN